MSDSVQIIIKKYDKTLFKTLLPEREGNKLIEHLSEKKDELAAHDYHGRLNTYYGGSNPND